ncbi:MAG TPA: non-ribosomal peptide synthetase [Thermoanaerobaculia bacterium]
MNVTADTPIADRFRSIVDAMSSTEALVSSSVRLTYGELDRWSDAVASDLAASDTPATSPMAIVTRDGVALVVATLAAVKAGRFFVAIDSAQPPERIAAAIGAASPSLCLVDGDVPPAIAQLPSVRLRSLTSCGDVTPPAVPPNAHVQIVFTSGTTGVPKAIVTSQRGFVERMIAAARSTGRAAGERVSYTSLPGFARATHEILGSLLNGATLVAFDARTEPLDVLAALIEREKLTVLTLTPALFRRFVAVLRPDADLSSLRKLRLGADVVNMADIEAYKARFPRSCTLERAFNASETGPVLHMSIDHDTHLPGPLVPMGRPRPGVEVRLVDDEGNDVPDGTAGEMLVRSPSVVEGYWHDTELTAQKFIPPDGGAGLWTFRTGDLALRDAAGLYYFIGRKDARLKIHGRRIDPSEIENALVMYAGAREAVVVGKATATGEARLAAYVVMREGLECVPRAIRTALREKLSSWMVPARIYAVESMPMNASGKVDRRLLTEREEIDPEAEMASASDLEKTLAAIWSRALETNASPEDDFFDDLGGESIVAAQIITEVNRATGRSMPLSSLVELRTIRTMAEYIRAEPDTDRVAVPIRSEGTLEPLFFVSGGAGSVLRFRELAHLLDKQQPFYGLTHHGFTLETFPRSLDALAACYVDAVRRIQPHGPYFLGGYSIGGRVAFTMARQLTNAGEAVSFVGMLDTSSTRRHASRGRTISRYLDTLRRQPLHNAKRYIRAVGRRILRVLRWLVGKGWTFASFSTPEIDALNAALRDLDMNALARYRGRVTLFLAEHEWGRHGAPLHLGWPDYCEGGVQVVSLPVDHHTIIREDVELLGDAMRRELERARITSASPTPTAAASLATA